MLLGSSLQAELKVIRKLQFPLGNAFLKKNITKFIRDSPY